VIIGPQQAGGVWVLMVPPSATVPAGLKPESRNDKPRLDPVRYGDWEKNGRCIDF